MKWPKLVLLFLFTAHLSLTGQQPAVDSSLLQLEELQVLQTIRGDIFMGKLLSLDQDSITFGIQELGPIRFGRDEIRHLDPVQDAGWLLEDAALNTDKFVRYQEDRDFWQHNLAYSATAFPYTRGVGEYRNVSILYNVVDVGVSTNVSVGGGLVLPYLFMFRTKAAVNLGEKIHLGAGMNNFVGLDPDFGGLIAHIYAVGTIGTPEEFINITVGPAFEWGDPQDDTVIVTVGGSISFASNWKVYTDIGVSPGNEGIIPTIMLSWFKKKNRLEIGVLGVADTNFNVIPMAGYARRF